MFYKWMMFLRILAVVTAVGVIAAFAGINYQFYYCTDELPDTSSVFVYTVDEGIGDLNRRYLDAKKMKVSDERFILYEDIPEIAKMDGIDAVYILDDAVLDDFSDGLYRGEITEGYVTVPSDLMKYFYDPSGMGSMFRLDPEGISGDSEYVFIRCAGKKAEQVTGTGSSEPYQFYYKYDESTWDDFMERLNDYLVEDDAISDVNMLITTSGSLEDTAALQDKLMEKYPGSNYLSNEFVKVFRNAMNKDYWISVIVFALIVIAVTIVIETVIGAAVKRVRASRQ